MLRTGLFRGVWRHSRTIPRLLRRVRGWPYLLADCLGLRRKPYRLRVAGGPRCELRPGRSDWWIFLEIFVFGIYRRVAEDIHRSRIIVDVGANVGLFALFAASLQPKVEIHAFEPFPDNLEHMKKNLALNNAQDRVHLHPEAVSDRSGTVRLHFTPGDDSGCSLNQPKAQSCPVAAITLGDVFRSCGIDSCDLLKMDCEGSELPILQAAAPEVLGRIQSIVLEYHAQEEVDSLVNILSRSGFTCEILPEIRTLYACRRQAL